MGKLRIVAIVVVLVVTSCLASVATAFGYQTVHWAGNGFSTAGTSANVAEAVTAAGAGPAAGLTAVRDLAPTPGARVSSCGLLNRFGDLGGFDLTGV